MLKWDWVRVGLALGILATGYPSSADEVPFAPTSAFLPDMGYLAVLPFNDQPGVNTWGIGPNSINDRGQVTGYGIDPNSGPDVAFLWDPQRTPYPTILGSLGSHARARGINATGTIIGEAVDPATNDLVSVAWDPDVSLVPIRLGTLGSTTTAYAINARGDIVGQAYDVRPTPGGAPANRQRAVLWPAGSYTLPPIPLDDFGLGAEARGVNSAREIVGYAVTSTNGVALMWRLGTSPSPVILAGFGGGVAPTLIDFNEAGQVVGTAFSPGGSFVGALWDPASDNFPLPILLGDLGPHDALPLGISTDGLILGTATDQVSSHRRAVVWDATNLPPAAVEIPPLALAMPPDTFAAIAHGITEGGAIVGEASTFHGHAAFWPYPLEAGAQPRLIQVTPEEASSSAWRGNSTGSVVGYADDLIDGMVFRRRGAFWQVGSPLPAVSGLNPAEVVAGSPAFTLVVRGTGFTWQSKVAVFGDGESDEGLALRPTRIVSANELHVEVRASDVAADGQRLVWVRNPGNAPASTFLTVHSRTEQCVGDCNGDSQITIDELIRGVKIALGDFPVDECRPVDANGDGTVSIDELIRSVNTALGISDPSSCSLTS